MLNKEKFMKYQVIPEQDVEIKRIGTYQNIVTQAAKMPQQNYVKDGNHHAQ